MGVDRRGARVHQSYTVPHAGEDGDYRVYRAPETVRFERHCAGRHRLSGAGIHTARIRGRASTRARRRLRAPRRGANPRHLIGMRLVALAVDSGTSAAGSHWSVRMRARSTGGVHVGAEHAHYDSNPARGVGGEAPVSR